MKPVNQNAAATPSKDLIERDRLALDASSGGGTAPTLTPNRDAARAAAAEARRTHAEALARDDADGIGQRMAIEAGEAILVGAADMMDREIDPQLIWPQIAKALAGPLSAFLMSASRGDQERAIDLLPGALRSIHELVLFRLQQGEAAFSVGETAGGHPAGRA